MSARPPVLREPSQRYWRRQANRRVRKARLARSLLRWSVVLMANTVVAGLLISAGWRVYRHVTSTPQLALERIEVDGTRRASADAIRKRLRTHLGCNLLDLDLKQVIADASDDPWVREVSARRILPHSLRITVVERVPRAVAMINGVAHVIDATGFVVGPSGAELPDDLPVLTGLDDLAGDELIAALRRGARIVGRLRQAAGSWVDEISEIDISGTDRVTVRTVRPGPLILLDPARVTRNVASYLELRRDIAMRVGAMQYVDLRWRDRISVMPAMEERS